MYFFSLDAESALAVAAARTLLHLPYFTAAMGVRVGAASDVAYETTRSDVSGAPATFVAQYRPTGVAQEPQPGTFDHFLTERYCLYNVDASYHPYRLEIHHLPWQLQAAEATISRNTMASAAGIDLPAIAPVLHFAKRQDMVAWEPDVLDSLGGTTPATSAS